MCKHPKSTSFRKMSMEWPLSPFLPAPIISPTPLVTKPRQGSSIITQQAVYFIREQKNTGVSFPGFFYPSISSKKPQAIKIFFKNSSIFHIVHAFPGPTIIIKLFQNFPFKNSFSPAISFMLLNYPQSSRSPIFFFFFSSNLVLQDSQ